MFLSGESLLLLVLFGLNFVAALPLSPTSLSPGLSKRDADFASVRTRLPMSKSGKAGDKNGKYFHESTFDPHYDGRFAELPLAYDERRIHLTALMQTYLSTMNDIGLETWIMHGSLLGWWWNQKIMPWDSDLDVQMGEHAMHHLAAYYNMTIHHYRLPGIAKGRDYMLEVNPHYVNGSTTDKLNVIDARWIDTETGLFIDITTLRRNETAEALGVEGAMMIKDRHHYMYDDIYPLRDSEFEGVPVKVPYAYSELLVEEYGEKALVQTKFQSHKFNEEKMEWIPLRPIHRWGGRPGRPPPGRNNGILHPFTPIPFRAGKVIKPAPDAPVPAVPTVAAEAVPAGAGSHP